MKRFSRFGLVVLTGMLAVALLGACDPSAPPERANTDSTSYLGALDTSYEGALDVPTQLALGTLRLEGETNAVTREQAADLLPLWQALSGSVLKGEMERAAVVAQIESSMGEDQVAAIAGMQLTATDLRAWAQTQGVGGAAGRQGPGSGQRPGGGGGQGGAGAQMSEEARATRRAQFQGMSDEERATRVAQFRAGSAPGGSTPGQSGGIAGGPLTAVIALLNERAGGSPPPGTQQRSSRTRSATVTPTYAPVGTRTAVPSTATSAADLEPTQTATVLPSATPTRATMEAQPGVTPTTASSTVRPLAATQAVYTSPALEQRPDTDPGPPVGVEVSANRAYPDPWVEHSRRYYVSGIVRNQGIEQLALSALHVTFFDAEGFRGSYQRFPGRGRTGGEWVWHGRTEADIACLLLAPGEQCPFVVEITAQNMASFLIHPDASVTQRQSAALEPSGMRLTRDGTEYVTIAGQVTNTYPFKVKNLILSGVLLDRAGEIVSLGSAYVIEEDIEPGQSVGFGIRIRDSTYSVGTMSASFEVYAQSERDWD